MWLMTGLELWQAAQEPVGQWAWRLPLGNKGQGWTSATTLRSTNWCCGFGGCRVDIADLSDNKRGVPKVITGMKLDCMGWTGVREEQNDPQGEAHTHQSCVSKQDRKATEGKAQSRPIPTSITAMDKMACHQTTRHGHGQGLPRSTPHHSWDRMSASACTPAGEVMGLASVGIAVF